MKVSVGCIVEGHGDVKALPELIRRIVCSGREGLYIAPEIVRVPKSRLKKPDELELHVELIARRVGPRSPVLIVVDADQDCARDLAASFHARARSARSDRAIGVVVATVEFEAWFLAAARSLRGIDGLPLDLDSPPEPESIRNAKGWLSDRMPGGYSETTHQAKLAKAIDLVMARESRSFDKLVREVEKLLAP